MTQAIYSHQFENGLVLLAESMDWLESTAFSLQIPSGFTNDPTSSLGLANFACDMVQRGCGDRDSRQFVEDLERLGVDHNCSVSAVFTGFGAALLADHLNDALEIFADLVRRPHLPESQLEEGRMVCLQELAAAEDDLVHRTMVALRNRQYGAPWGRSSQGKQDHIMAVTADQIREYVGETYQPDGAMLSVAGKLDWPALKDTVEKLFGDWQPRRRSILDASPASRGYEQIPFESNQTQIGVAYDSVPYSDPDYFQARGAVGVLSDGMSSRLFTEVREKRGLCYTVHASCHSLRDRGSVLAYAATSTENSQQTLDVMIAELNRLTDGVEEAELARLKARIKSSLIMQQESSSARSFAMAGDWYHLGRVLTMEEISGVIDGLTCDSINDYLRRHPPREFTVVSLGDNRLEVPNGVA